MSCPLIAFIRNLCLSLQLFLSNSYVRSHIHIYLCLIVCVIFEFHSLKIVWISFRVLIMALLWIYCKELESVDEMLYIPKHFFDFDFQLKCNLIFGFGSICVIITSNIFGHFMNIQKIYGYY